MTTFTKLEQIEATNTLRKILSPGDVLYTNVKHVSRSGMMRHISVYVMRDNQPIWLSRLVAKALLYAYHDRNEAVKIGGCGMDMGFALVHSLSYQLFPDVYTTHPLGGDDSIGGYALKQRWL